MPRFFREKYPLSSMNEQELSSSEFHNYLHFPYGNVKLAGSECGFLRNFWPSSRNPIVRGGCKKVCNINNNSNIVTAFSYQSGFKKRVFIANDRAIYDVSYPELGEAVKPCVYNMHSGDWSTFQFSTPEKTFLIAVNGKDERQIYDGNQWISDHPKIIFEGNNNKDYIRFLYGWMFKNRQWYIASYSMDAWYLPIRSLGGVAKVFPLGGIMQSGGSLIAGFSWSTESGDGLSALCVFISTVGEVAVYGGDDPDNASSFALKAIYHIGRPLGKNAIAFVRNDVLIATINGLISMKNILVMEGKESLPLSWSIQEEWDQSVVASPVGWSLTVWEKRNMLLVTFPRNSILSDKTFVMNISNNNWSSFHNWLAQAYVISNENVFFGDYEGSFWQGDITGSDNGKPFSAVYLSYFQAGNSYLSKKKRACFANMTISAYERPYVKLFARSDYDKSYPNFSKATINNHPDIGGIWDNSAWDYSSWRDDFFVRKKIIFNFCQNVTAYGDFLAIGCIITSAGMDINDIQINNAKLLIE
ncbi:hypothetical protein [Candidatus Liberibacter americanus]|uniref:Uncharacterized protein n=2 Tax=Candidatus Liberibacter americanus TaxID=309868 RepID=U6B803_9HYPH|nr:hypothetical protein [Candidatus Liberibacter americanus]AHA27857.1 hypothetical protein lam_498 [Candidatus Liberibacter americanus str. Sao Paulo]EMS35902.1 hypothetical protein G653_04231 [Candidatus Liberibacter americanus PW_SP]